MTRWTLPPDRIPSAWFNVVPHLPKPVDPPLHPGTREPVGPDDVIATLERARLRGERGEPGKVTVLDLERARTGRFEVVFVLGLEEGSLPRRGGGTPFLDDEARERLGSRLQRADRCRPLPSPR